MAFFIPIYYTQGMKTKLTIVSIVVATFICTAQTARASEFGIAGVDIFAKSMTSRMITASKTDARGAFSIVGKDEGDYELFVNDESMPPVILKSKNKVLKGRVAVIVDDGEAKIVRKEVVKNVSPKLIEKPKTLPMFDLSGRR
jgi:hypothetical protein